MKKLFVLLAIALPMLLISCNKDDEKKEQDAIVGLWELTKSYIEEDNRWYYAEDDISQLHEIEFCGDGSGQFNDYYKSEIRVTPFAWVVADKQLRMVMGENSDSYKAYVIESMSENELIISREKVRSYYKRMK